MTDSQINTGHALIKTSLILQIVVAVLFITLATTFNRRCLANGIKNDRLNVPLATLYTSISLILVRTIYRIVEYFGVASLRIGPGFDPMSMSPVIRYEWFFYVFEATIMLTNVVMFNLRHPRHFLPRNTKIYLAQDGVTEVEGPGFKDPRPFWMTLVDPFDIRGILTGQSKQENFWETHDQPTSRESQERPKSDTELV